MGQSGCASSCLHSPPSSFCLELALLAAPPSCPVSPCCQALGAAFRLENSPLPEHWPSPFSASSELHPALGAHTARCWQLSCSPLDVFLLTRAACVDSLMPPCELWLFPEPELVMAAFSTLCVDHLMVDLGISCRKTPFFFSFFFLEND